MRHNDFRSQGGFTLTELMVIVVILAILALIAVPALTRDSAKKDFTKFSNEISQLIQMARIGAISGKEDRAILLTRSPSRARLTAVSGGVYADLRQADARPQMEISGFALNITSPAASPACTDASAELFFDSQGTVSVKKSACLAGLSGSKCDPPNCTAGYCCSPVAIYLKTLDDKLKARILIYNIVGYARLYEGW